MLTVSPSPSRPPSVCLSQSPSAVKDFESVELGDLGRREKAPRRIIHFSSGETMEEYSTDEEEAGEDEQPEKKDLLSPVDAVRCVRACA